MYKVNRNTAGALVVHANNQTFTFTPATNQQRKRILNVHRLANEAVFKTESLKELEKVNNDDLVKMLLGVNHAPLQRLGEHQTKEVASIVFRWNIAGIPAALGLALKYNKRDST